MYGINSRKQSNSLGDRRAHMGREAEMELAESLAPAAASFSASPRKAMEGGRATKMSSYLNRTSPRPSSTDEKPGSGMLGESREGAVLPAFDQLIPQGLSADQAYGIVGNYERFNQAIGLVLKKMANEQSLSCTSLARVTGIPRSTVSRYLNAKAPIPLYAFILLCHALNCNIIQVVGRALILLSN